jgi:Tfp pilus assembly protein PilN
MRAVNLLPTTRGVGASLSGARARVLLVGAAVALAAMGWWGYSANQSADAVTAQVAQGQLQKSNLDQEIAGLTVYSQRQQTQAAERSVVVQLASSRTDWERLVRNVITVLPSGVWLNTINGSLPTANAAAAPSAPASAGALPQPDSSAPLGLHIVGDAFTQGEVSAMLASLATVPGLGAPRLASSLATVTSGKTILSFTVDVPIDAQAQDLPTVTAAASTQGVTP